MNTMQGLFESRINLNIYNEPVNMETIFLLRLNIYTTMNKLKNYKKIENIKILKFVSISNNLCSFIFF